MTVERFMTPGANIGTVLGEIMENYFQIGIITGTHGLRGEVKVYPTTDDAGRFKKLKEVILVPSQERYPRETDITLEIESVKFFKQFVFLKFRGADRIEDVERYCRHSLYVPRSNAVRLNRDEYFIADLMGLVVKDETGSRIGVLKDVMETGANDVYVITLDDGRELLLPAIKQCVLAVDIEAGFITIHILDGLL